MSNEISVKSQVLAQVQRRYKMVAGADGDINAPWMLMNDKTGGTFVSPNLAQMFDGTPIPFDAFLRSVAPEITPKVLHTWFDKIRQQALTLVSIGYGGMSINVIHFMERLKDWAEYHHPLFKTLAIHEEDSISLLNALRIYKPLANIPAEPGSQNKLGIFTEHSLAERVVLVDERLDQELLDSPNEAGVLTKDRTDFRMFGAPDFETRSILSNQPFYFIGHGGDEVSVIIRPKVDSALQRETYGLINLATFFPNMLRATIVLLECLAEDVQASSPDDHVYFNYKVGQDA